MSRVKGITIWEQYVEFIVLGVVTIVALAFIAMQFIGQPNAIERQPQGKIGPGQVDRVLQDEATRIQGLLTAARVPEGGEEHRPLRPEIEQTLQASIAPAPRISPMVAFVPLRPADFQGGAVRYVEPQVPAPTHVIARQFHDTVTDDAVEAHNLTAIFSSRPYDVIWNTVVGVFDAAEALKSFKAAGPEGDPAAIPSSWHQDQIFPLNVVMEVSEYLDGRWSEPRQVEPIPGQRHLREKLAKNVDAGLRDELLRAARATDIRTALLQPEFYSTKGGAWTAPDPYEVDAGDGDERAQARTLMRRLGSARREKVDLVKRIEDLEGRSSSGPSGTGRGGGGTTGGAGGDFGGGGLVGGGARPGGGEGGRSGQDVTRALEEAKQRLERVELRIQQIEAELRAMGEDVRSIDAPEGEIVFWAHDLGVEPGRTYRYRFIVEVYNPYCARKLHLLEEQHSLAESFVLRTEPSEWSDPITIEPPVRTFITRAEPALHRPGAGPLGLVPTMGSVTVEVYRFHDGRWWDARMTVEPGGRIWGGRPGRRGEDSPTVDFATEWYVLDIIPDPDAPRTSDGQGARVILQNVRTGEIEERHPLWDAPSRRILIDEIERLKRRASL